jgi:hypothetical protein
MNIDELIDLLKYTSFFLTDGYQPSNGAKKNYVIDTFMDLLNNSSSEKIKEIAPYLKKIPLSYKYFVEKTPEGKRILKVKESSVSPLFSKSTIMDFNYIFLITGYNKHAIGMCVRKITFDEYIFYLYNVGENAKESKKFTIEGKDYTLLNAISAFKVNETNLLQRQLFFQLLYGLPYGDPTVLKLPEKLDDGNILYDNYIDVIEKLKEIGCEIDINENLSDEYKNLSLNLFILDKHIVIRDGTIYMDGQISGTCTFHSNLIFLIHHFMMKYPTDFISEIDNVLYEFAKYSLETLETELTIDNYLTEFMNFYFALVKKKEFILNFEVPTGFIFLDKLSKYIKSVIKDEQFYYKQMLEKKLVKEYTLIKNVRKDGTYDGKFIDFIKNIEYSYKTPQYNNYLIYCMDYATDDIFDYNDSDNLGEILDKLNVKVLRQTFLHEDMIKSKYMYLTLITYMIYLKNKTRPEFNIELTEEDYNLMNIHYSITFHALFSQKIGWNKIQIFMKFLLYMTKINDDRPYDDNSVTTPDKLEIYGIDFNSRTIDGEQMNRLYEGEIRLQYGFVNKGEIIPKLVSLIYNNFIIPAIKIPHYDSLFNKTPHLIEKVINENLLEEALINNSSLTHIDVLYSSNIIPYLFNTKNIFIEYHKYLNYELVKNNLNKIKKFMSFEEMEYTIKKIFLKYNIKTENVEYSHFITEYYKILEFNLEEINELFKPYDIQFTDLFEFSQIHYNIYKKSNVVYILDRVNKICHKLDDYEEVELTGSFGTFLKEYFKDVYSFLKLTIEEDKFTIYYIYCDGNLLRLTEKYDSSTDSFKINELFLIENNKEYKIKLNYTHFENILYNIVNLVITENNEYILLRNKHPKIIINSVYIYNDTVNVIDSDRLVKILFSEDFTRILNNDVEELFIIWKSAMVVGNPIITQMVFNKIVNNNYLNIFRNKIRRIPGLKNINMSSFLCNFYDIYFSNKIEFSDYYWIIEPRTTEYDVKFWSNKELYDFFLKKTKYDNELLISFYREVIIDNFNINLITPSEDKQIQDYVSTLTNYTLKNKVNLRDLLTKKDTQFRTRYEELSRELLVNYINYLFKKNSYLLFIRDNFESILEYIEISQILKFITGVLTNDLFDSNPELIINEYIGLIQVESLNVAVEKYNYEYLFEYLFGFITTKRQTDLVKNILEDLQPEVKQLLMGQGKTSVITPLIFLHQFFNEENVITILPNHLINDTNNIFVQLNLLPFEINTINYHNLPKKIDLYERKDYRNQLIIIDSESIKYHLITNRINKNNNNIKDYYIIFDEIDYQINYLSSEFNIPSGDKKQLNKNYILAIFTLIVKFNELFKIDNLEVLTPQEKNIYLLKYIFKDKYKCYLELFSLDISEFIINFNKEHLIHTLKVLRIPTDDISDIENETTYELYSLFKIMLYYLVQTIGMIYNKDYGRSSYPNKLIAVPYSSVNTPINDSQFSNIYLTEILTILSYLNGGFTQSDCELMIMKEIKDYYSTPFIDIENKTEIHSIIDEIELNYDDILNESKINSNAILMRDKLNALKTSNKRNFENNIEYYIIDFVLPQLIYNSFQYSSSFVNIVSPYYTSKNKCGFSGSVNFDFPEYEEKLQKENFKIIPKEDNFSIGAVKSAILGHILITKIYYEETSSKIEFIDKILEKMRINNIGILIDIGAIFKDYSGKEIAEKIYNIFESKRDVFFLDDDSNKLMIEKNTKNILPMSLSKNPDEIAGVYTQNKIVGIDIKLPYGCHFIATITHQSKLTEVSQGIFRARKLNLGHYLHFIHSKIHFSKSVENSKTLLKLLELNEENYKRNLETNKLIQYIKDVKMFETDIIKYPVFIEELSNETENLNDLKLQFINENICNDDDLEVIKSKCGNIKDSLIKMIETEIVHENEEEEEEEEEEETEIETNIETKIDKNHPQFYDYNIIFKNIESFVDLVNNIFDPEYIFNYTLINDDREPISQILFKEMFNDFGLNITYMALYSINNVIVGKYIQFKLQRIKILPIYFVEIWDNDNFLRTVICSRPQAHVLLNILDNYEDGLYYRDINFDMFRKYKYKVFDVRGKNVNNPILKMREPILLNLVNIVRQHDEISEKDVGLMIIFYGIEKVKKYLPILHSRLLRLIPKKFEIKKLKSKSDKEREKMLSNNLKSVLGDSHLFYKWTMEKTIDLTNFIKTHYSKSHEDKIFNYFKKLLETNKDITII